MSTNPYGFPITVPGSKAPVRMWSPLYDVDHTTQQQIRNASLLPWVHGVAVMPDVHAGAGVTVGSVIAMHGAVSPAAVGVDIGCGMMAVKTTATLSDLPDNLAGIRAAWENVVPVGFAKHKTHAALLGETVLCAAMSRSFSHVSLISALMSPQRKTTRSGNAERSAAATTSSSCAATTTAFCG